MEKKKLKKSTTLAISPKKNTSYIFQIGFNRCATQSLSNAFHNVGLKTIHHNFKPNSTCPRQYLAILMYNNLNSKSNEIIQYELKDYQCFFDMEYNFENNLLVFYTFFKEIEKQNKGSTFIMNIRSCESWILSRIKLGKIVNSGIYYKDITEDKLKSWVEHYFEHSINVRNYFLHNTNVKKRSKLFILPIEHKTITELLKEMNLYHNNTKIVEKVDFAKNIKLNNKEKIIPLSITNLIRENIKKHGDPSTTEWWI